MFDQNKSEKYSLLETLGMGPYAMKKLKVCQFCGQLAKSRDLFCPVCKRILGGKTLFDRYKAMHLCCPSCNTTLAEDTRYCPHCGKKQANH